VPKMIEPHGGVLLDLIAAQDLVESAELRARSAGWPSWDLTPRQLCDLELLLSGAFSPLGGFLGRADYDSVCSSLRLADGTLWPIPVVLDLPDAAAGPLDAASWLALRDPEGVMLAALEVSEVWEPDREQEAKSVYGTNDPTHPGVAYLMERTNRWYVGGRLVGMSNPVHHDYSALRHTPAQLRAELDQRGWHKVVAFQTRNPMHRAHVELTLRAGREHQAKLLIHPVVGMTKPGDVDHHTRVRCYRAVMTGYPPDTAMLSLLPLAMRMAGPREAVWHAIIRKNHGASHFIVGRDHAGPGQDPDGRPYYQPYEAQELLAGYQDELGVQMVPFEQVVYVADQDTYLPLGEVPPGAGTSDISGTELRRLLAAGEELPQWFTYPEVAEELRRSYPARIDQGFTILFTGLSGAGKSTIASALATRLAELGNRTVTLLDGDDVRKHLSSELGFSREHRNLNVTRIGWVAAQLTRHGGAVICAPIAPFDQPRQEVRTMVAAEGGFFLVHVSTTLEVCEGRDRKGLYAKARAGLIPEFTGISQPYETPEDAEITIDAARVTPEGAVEIILAHLRDEGYLP
jgi:sulfate adenylyltransferase